MGFTFNEEDLVKAGEGKVFNNGKAGKVKGVTVTMEQLGVDYESQSPNAPKYRVMFTDAEGRKVNRACFSINSADYPNQWGGTYEQAIKKEWAFLNKIVEHSGGTKVFSFADDADLYAQVKGAMGSGEINVFTNYGSSRSPKDRLEVRKWLPAVEPGNTPDDKSKLVPGNIDQMTLVSADAPTEDEIENDFFA